MTYLGFECNWPKQAEQKQRIDCLQGFDSMTKKYSVECVADHTSSIRIQASEPSM